MNSSVHTRQPRMTFFVADQNCTFVLLRTWKQVNSGCYIYSIATMRKLIWQRIEFGYFILIATIRFWNQSIKFYLVVAFRVWFRNLVITSRRRTFVSKEYELSSPSPSSWDKEWVCHSGNSNRILSDKQIWVILTLFQQVSAGLFHHHSDAMASSSFWYVLTAGKVESFCCFSVFSVD